MNKTIILAAAGALLLGGNARAVTMNKLCKDFGTLGYSIAQARESGISLAETEAMIRDALPDRADRIARDIEFRTAEQIYTNWADKSPEEVQMSLQLGCLGKKEEWR